MSGPDYIVDLGGSGTPSSPKGQGKGLQGRRWLAIHWRCCSAYSRIYRRPDGAAYEGRCPRCQRLLQVPIGPGGTSSRFFEAY